MARMSGRAGRVAAWFAAASALVLVYAGGLAGLAPAAQAAEYQTFMTCSAEPGHPLLPAHACTTGQQPKAFFESDTSVTVRSCLVSPTGRERCAAELEAEAGHLYVFTIDTTLLGKFDLRWFVAGAEVGNWPFEMLTVEEQEEEGKRSQRTVLACAGESFVSLVFLAHPNRCVDRVAAGGPTGAAALRGVRWRDWNSPSAQGRGWFRDCGKHGCAVGRARVAAFDRKFACGRYAYTRLTVHFAAGGRRVRAVRIHLPSC